MSQIQVDFQRRIGLIKPMHSVNNGPVVSPAHGFGNFEDYAAARFPMARTHDASFTPAYGESHTVDILAVFPDFDADENDPASYDFALTDEYMEHIHAAGTGVFYRLGHRIEHESKRYGAIPPKDPAKWARICEHLIRHLNEGWADGHHLGIEYWEIWNEPDLHPQCWDGPAEKFFELYDIASRHLKACFPALKIGGPAVTSSRNTAFLEPFFAYLTRDREHPAPMDFFSFHRYTTDPNTFAADAETARELTERYGYGDAELILNEWNYVKSWTREDLLESYYTIVSLKGAAFAAASVLTAQRSPLDHFMYYDASPNVKWNGLFDRFTQKPLKAYFALKAFGTLYDLGGAVLSESDTPGVYTAAAVSGDGNEAAVMLAFYPENGSGAQNGALRLKLNWNGFAAQSGVDAVYCVLDEEHELDPLSEETFFGASGAHIFSILPYTVMLVKLKKRPVPQ